MLVVLTFRRDVQLEVVSSAMYHNTLDLHILSQVITQFCVLTAISKTQGQVSNCLEVRGRLRRENFISATLTMRHLPE